MLYDAILIGAGPIGLEMASVLRRADISYVHLESGQVGSAIARWPHNTQFFSSPEWVSLAGVPIHSVSQSALTGEEYLAYLRSLVETLDLPIRTYEPVVELSGRKGDFSARTRDLAGDVHTYRGRTVILATGDLNRPRMLGVRGEELPHVTHYWSDPHDYFRRRLLIVGGRNSAIEAAVRCWRAGAYVTLSYRRRAIDEGRTISRLALEARLLIEKDRIDFLPESRVREFRPGVTIMDDGREIPTDFAYLATGYEMDFTLYDQLGIRRRGDEARPEYDPQTMESNVPGAYVVGTATGGNQDRFTVFITTSHEHCLRAARSIAPELEIPEAWVGNIAARDYPLSSSDIE
ncbi:MAG: NAD(P)-binding domain-containing protein [Spirochaetales bacterium]|nr:NAD(P)-binding domain-containing protein [Spirochaetales bacterium]